MNCTGMDIPFRMQKLRNVKMQDFSLLVWCMCPFDNCWWLVRNIWVHSVTLLWETTLMKMYC